MTEYKDPPPPYSCEQMPGVHHSQGPPPQVVYPANAQPPPQGYFGSPPYQGYGATTTTVIVTPPDVVVIGACPACRVGVLEDDFTCLGVLCAIFFFPLGILCCLAMREKTCSHCGATFG